jgi:hypothetical protein
MGDEKCIIGLLFISGGVAVNSLVAFYDIHGRNEEVLFFYSASVTTRDFTDSIPVIL